VASEKKIIFVSNMSEEETRSLFARKAATVQEAIEMALADQGNDAKFTVLPEGSLTVPSMSAE